MEQIKSLTDKNVTLKTSRFIGKQDFISSIFKTVQLQNYHVQNSINKYIHFADMLYNPLLDSIGIWPTRVSRLAARAFYHYCTTKPEISEANLFLRSWTPACNIIHRDQDFIGMWDVMTAWQSESGHLDFS